MLLEIRPIEGAGEQELAIIFKEERERSGWIEVAAKARLDPSQEEYIGH
ncbi:MAG: hypothetical protein LBQ69_01670 [Treponema sp.]|jgi:hypothetical protein|nr:hypothetical protein [Treponema sp.]